jgi:DNA-directed RNA polymerase subunit beta'
MYKSLTFDKLDQQMIDTAQSTIKSLFPIVGRRNKLELRGLTIRESNDPFDYASQKEAINTEKTWGSKIVADFVLRDESNKIVDKGKSTIAVIPRVTPRGTFIIDGKENFIKNQLRLKPGVYTKKNPDGSIESWFNMAIGKGRFQNLRITTKPRTGKMQLSIKDKHYDIYPILKAYNIPDGQIAEIMGPEIYSSNTSSIAPVQILKMAKDLGEEPDSVEAAASTIRNAFSTVSFENGANDLLLGKKYTTINSPFIISVVKKNLNVLRGREKEDDRNNISFKNIYTVADNLRERVMHHSFDMRRNMRQKIDSHNTVATVIAGNKVNKLILDLFKQGELKEYAKQTNPLTWVDNLTVVTLGGPGGIQSKHQVSQEMAQLQPSSIGFMDPIQVSESSEDIGTKYHFASGAEIINGELKTLVETLEGKTKYITPAEAYNAKIILPGQGKKTHVRITHRGEISENKRSVADYIFPSSSNLFGPITNTIPFLSSTYVKRANVGVKQTGQALPLIHREVPLVQTEIDGRSPMEAIATIVNSYAPVKGRVTRVDGENMKIHVKGIDGKLHKIPFFKDFPLNFESYADSDIKVKIGDEVSKGELLAESNFSKGKELATGVNLRTSILPYRGKGYEDSFLLSETGAQKLTSMHMLKYEVDRAKNDLLNLSRFAMHFPAIIHKIDLTNYDEDGVAKKGAIIQPNHPVILHATEKQMSPSDVALGKFHKLLRMPYQENVVENHVNIPGQVIDVVKTKKNIKVYLKTIEPAQVGDKVASRMGGKGIISAILPDTEMPRTSDGKIPDMIFNPLGISSRMNASQILELGAAKAAEKLGKPVRMKNFVTDQDSVSFVKGLMKDAKVNDKEEMFDAQTGKSIGNVAIGPMYIHKLHHSVRDKVKTRDFGTYNMNELPSKHGEDSSQKIDAMGLYALLAHGARANLTEMSSYKAGKNEEFWRAIQLGLPVPAPKESYVVDKFSQYMRALGVNMTRKGDTLYMMPFTDQHTLQISGGEIKGKSGRVGFVRARDFMPETGGFFDSDVTGGLFGDKWSHIKLTTPVPNPIYEPAIASILKIQEKDIQRIIDGAIGLTPSGKITPDGPKGARSIFDALANLNVPKSLEIARLDALKEAKTPTKARLDLLNRRIRYLKNLHELGARPEQVYIQQVVPVVPPKFRPIYTQPGNTIQVSPVNYLYRDLWVENNAIKDLKETGGPAAITQPLEGTLYKAVKALAGLTDPINVQSKQKGAVGFIEYLKGRTSPKEGFIQQNLLSKRQDMTMRSVITVDPSLGIDELGLPREQLWILFRPFIIRELIRRGYNILDAQQAVSDRTSVAASILDDVSKDRPVLVTRDPKIHKFSIIAQKAIPVSGNSIRLSPLVTKGMNADFDGDQVAVHVPVTEMAKEEAKKMYPSRNMFGAGGSVINMPAHEAQWGLAEMTAPGKPTTKKFASQQKAIEAYHNGVIGITDIIQAGNLTTTVGKILVNASIPQKYQDHKAIFDKNLTKTLAKKIIVDYPTYVPGMVNTWKDLGNEYAYQSGFTIGIDDLSISKATRDRLAEHAASQVKIATDKPGASERLGEEINKEFIDSLRPVDKKNNAIYRMMKAGARGDRGNFQQLLGIYGPMKGAGGRTMPFLNKGNLSQGMSFPDYLGTLFQGRESIVATYKGVPLGGEFAKETVNSAIDVLITEKDCGTSSGILVARDDEKQLLGRFIVGQESQGPITSSSSIKTRHVKIRSPLTCEAKNGVCRICYGLNDNMHLPQIGDNIGVHAATSLSEPVTQLLLRQFHAGAGTSKSLGTAYDRVRGLFFMPENIKNKAVLAQHSGEVTDVRPGPAGGDVIQIQNAEHFIPESGSRLVGKGDIVQRGQPISSGIPHPKEVFKLRGIDATRKQLLGDLRDIYENVADVSPHHFETSILALTNQTRILEPGDNKEYEPGDVALLSEVRNKNRTLKNSIVHEPFITGAKVIPTLKKDFLTQVSRREIKKAITRGAGQGWRSPIRGYSPLNPWILGSFSETIGPRGEY